MFSKKPAPDHSPMASSRSSSASTFSILGADIALKGDISATADLHIDGKVEGDISCAALVQGESSEVQGAISAESARLAGTVRGTITVAELVVLRSARIEGDVFYDALTIEQGAQVDGRLTPRGAKAPDQLPLGAPGSEAHLILASSSD